MSDALVSGIFLIVSSIAGGAIATLSSRRGEELGRMRVEIDGLKQRQNKLLRQIEAYHLLEDIYAGAIAESRSANSTRPIKTEFRDRVVEAHQCQRPQMTANDAREYLAT